MALLIDIGNSRIKWASLDAGELCRVDAIDHRGDSGAIEAMLDRIAMVPFRVVVANVAGDALADRIVAAVHQRWNLPVQFATTQRRAGVVRNGYEEYLKLGIDRWLAIIAAFDRFAGPLCIVDAGTAVTIDAVAADGMHRGGYIVPGLDLMRQSLDAETGDLHRLAADNAQQTVAGIDMGKSTAEAIAGGALAAVCCLIDHCSGARGDRTEAATLVVTGGDAERLLPHLGAHARHRPQLVLEGLAKYACDERARD